MNFGEIILPSSRAFWDDFDDDELSRNESNYIGKVNWIWLTNTNISPKELKVNSLYVIEGSGMKEFVTTTVLQYLKPVAKDLNEKVQVYYIPETFQMICFSNENDLNSSSLYTECLSFFIEHAAKVITFSLLSNIQYKGEDLSNLKNDVIFIRGINSETHVKKLEVPNYITGLSAGVASFRHMRTLPVSSYVAYADLANNLDAIAAQPILNLFHVIGIKCDTKFVQKYRSPSHLYM